MADDRFLVDVIRHRRLVRIGLRLCAGVLSFLSMRWGAYWAMFAIAPAQAFGEPSGLDYPIMMGLYGGVALLIILTEPTLVRWIVPHHPGGCAGCGYPVEEEPRCPECGLPVPPKGTS